MAYMALPFNYTLLVSTRNHDIKRGFSGPQRNRFKVFPLDPTMPFLRGCGNDPLLAPASTPFTVLFSPLSPAFTLVSIDINPGTTYANYF